MGTPRAYCVALARRGASHVRKVDVPRSLTSVGIPIETPVLHPAETIPGLLPTTGQLILAGDTNVGKTLVALEIASAVLTGGLLWGALPVRKGEKVLYVLAEHHTSTLQGLWEKTGLPTPPRSLWVVGPHEFSDHHVLVRGVPQFLVLQQMQAWATECALVVFDPLAAFVRGENVENDNAQMRLVVDSLTGVAERAGAACVILAHSGKPSRGEHGERIQRGEYRIRGASAIEDAASAVFYMEHGTGGVFTLRRRKYKGAQEPRTYALARDPETLRHTLVSGRPATHDKQTQFLEKLQKMTETMLRPDAMRLLCSLEGVSESTAYRWVGGTAP